MGNLNSAGYPHRQTGCRMMSGRPLRFYPLVSLFGLLTIFALATIRVADAGDQVETSVLVQTATVLSKQVSQQIEVYGTVEPDPDVLGVVALPRAGLITRVHVRLGERVKAGDALLELDTAPATRMQYAQAEAARKYAQGQLERTRQLFDQQLATRDQVASAERELSDATEQLRALAKVGANEARQTIRAGSDGIVAGLSVTAGDRVSADTTAVLLARADGLIVRLGIEPEDAQRIPQGAAVELVSVFQEENRVSTRIVKTGAMINPATRLVDAIAPVPVEAVGRMTLGSTMRAAVLLSEQMALVVPRSAVLRDMEGAYVFAVEDDRARRIPVKVVYESSTETGIDSVLQEGAVVVISGNYELSDGTALRVSDASK
jgi:membrane fusion protein (multidrug efflux system)